MEGGNFLNGIGDEVLRESEAELRMKADKQYVGGSSTAPHLQAVSVASAFFSTLSFFQLCLSPSRAPSLNTLQLEAASGSSE